MLKNASLSQLKSSKNLLAFSAGGDSTALLFLLLENSIAFDIAIVDYGLREQSKEEVAYAMHLAKEHNLQCYLHTADSIESNFEAKARELRYDFFETLIKEHSYENLLTAHHLGDRFEWMLMQFCKGAGCVELSGMQTKEKRDKYTLYRPLLHLDKSELLEYLHKQQIKYFEDASNADEKYKRNYFRKHHCKPLLEKHLQGIKKSFEYMDEDVQSLTQEVELFRYKEFAYFKTTQSKRSDITAIDKYFKTEGKVLTSHERAALKKENSVIIARKYVVNFNEKYIFIMPYIKGEKMSKNFREQMRVAHVEPKLRGYLATDLEVLSSFLALL